MKDDLREMQVLQALREKGYTWSEVGEELNMSRSTAFSKLKRHKRRWHDVLSAPQPVKEVKPMTSPKYSYSHPGALTDPAEWMLCPRPVSPIGKYYIYMLVTPALAKMWLESSNTENRNLVELNLRKMIADVEQEAWIDSGQTITFDLEGVLINGQHRLHLCLETNQAIAFDIIFGLPKKAHEVSDIGATRTTADIATIVKVPRAKMVTAVSRMLLIDEKDRLNAYGWNQNVSTHEVLDFYRSHADEIQNAVRATSQWNTRKLAAPRSAGTCYYQFQRPGQLELLAEPLQELGIEQVCHIFFTRALEGTDDNNDPAYHLHRELVRLKGDRKGTRITAEHYVALFRIAWVHFRRAHALKRLSFKYGDFPQI